MDLETAIPTWWTNPQSLFDVFKDASLELLVSLVFGLAGYALIKWLGWFPYFQEKRMWIPLVTVTPMVGFLSAWRYLKFMSPQEVPAVKIDPQEYIFLMTVTVAIVPGFIIMPMVMRLMKKRGSSGDTGTWKKSDAPE